MEEAGGAQVHAALMDVYTTHYQPPEPRNHMLPALSAPPAAAKRPYVFSRDFYLSRDFLFLGRVVVGFEVDCPLLSCASFLFLPLGSPPLSSAPRPPSSALPCSLLLPLLLPVTALTVWLHVKAGAFCGSVTNLPGKTETICSGLGLRGDEGVNT